jgi:hypothetical protein
MGRPDMVEPRQLALIHAEIDSELDAEQRAELARCVLADPEVRAVREDLRRLCTALDGLVPVEPPAQLRESVLAALPQSSFRPRQSFVPRWRYAAVIAGMLAAGVLVLETLRAPETASSDAAGTMASAPAPTIIDTVRLGSGPVSGRVSLYRDPKGAGLEFELAASAPVDVLISSGGHTLRVNGLGRHPNPVGSRTAVPLPDFGTGGQTVDLTFLMAGRRVGGATLRASGGS